MEDGEVLEDGPRLLPGMFYLEVRLRSAPWALQGERRSCLRAVVRPGQAGHAPVRGRQGAGSGQVPEAGDGERGADKWSSSWQQLRGPGRARTPDQRWHGCAA